MNSRKRFQLASAAVFAAFVVNGASGSEDPTVALRDFRSPVKVGREVCQGNVWLEAEEFADYGGWKIDTQFIHKMGSAYLIASGVLKPKAPARTKFQVKTAGKWQALVRTKDWLPEFSPGKFTLSIDGKRSGTLGASKRVGWGWESGGEYTLSAGEHEIELVDLSGGFARCDAILMTMQKGLDLPNEGDELAAARIRLSGGEPTIDERTGFDVVVVGAGPAGLGAAIASARNGARTVIVHDRPVLGGNASIEQHTSIGGASSNNRVAGATDTREGGLLEESRLMRKLGVATSNSDAFQKMSDAESRLTIYANERVIGAERQGERVTAVTSVNTLTGKRTRYTGKIFVDGTGDGWIGRFVGAEMMYGREGKSAYDEKEAPEKPDELTMSGCIDDYRYHKVGKEVPFELPKWARVLPEGFDRSDVGGLGARWWLEHPGTFDDLRDPERARDELIRIHLDYWNWLRNHPRFGQEARLCTLDEIKIHNGRREGWRMIGDYVLTANDCHAGRIFPDAITYGGWALDLHDPRGVTNPKGNGWWSVDHCKVYTIPYRCIYARGFENLFMCGRNISVTHAALGSTRIMATIFTLGQAAGTAAALMLEKGATTRQLGERHIGELQQRLLKDDLFIPSIVNRDQSDKARKAKVTASSTMEEVAYGRDDPDFRGVTACWPWHEGLWLDVAACFTRNNLERLEEVVCYLRNHGNSEREVVAEIYESDAVAPGDATRLLMATARATVPKGGATFVPFKLDKGIALTKKYVWIKLRKCDGVVWFNRVHVFPEGGCMAFGKKAGELELRPWYQMAFYTIPTRTGRVDVKPEYVIDGQSRPDYLPEIGTCTHAWRADPKATLPQWVQLDFKGVESIREVRVVFDTSLTTDGNLGLDTLVRDYAVLALVEDQWKTLAEVKKNHQRLAVHRFASIKASAIRVRVNATYGLAPCIQEIRAY